MDKALLDTDIFSEVLKGIDHAVTAQAVAYRADPMIAAIALQHQLSLVTGNQAHFRRIAALGYPIKLENWRQAPVAGQ